MNKSDFDFVSIDGRYLAHSYTKQGKSFALRDIVHTYGSDAFSEVYFLTISGNIYHIHKPRTKSGMPGDDFVLTNARENADKGDDTKFYTFGEEALTALTLKVGDDFVYAEGHGWTTQVVEIVPVTSPRCYVKGYFEEHGILPSSIKDDFQAIVYGERQTTTGVHNGR